MADGAGELEQALRDGFSESDLGGGTVSYRFVRPDDDLVAITEMLHAAYKPLADAGMRFHASFQDVEVTKARMGWGETIIAVSGDQVIGTVTLRPHNPGNRSSHYSMPGVFAFGQFAVDPRLQRRGIGSRLVELVEARARERGAVAVALDTSERADHLIKWYESLGYSFVEYIQWDLEVVNYRSVVLSKPLD
jgi:ribosomal protein S18 acetylase RimI-like enzyme